MVCFRVLFKGVCILQFTHILSLNNISKYCTSLSHLFSLTVVLPACAVHVLCRECCLIVDLYYKCVLKITLHYILSLERKTCRNTYSIEKVNSNVMED